jgi:hypothetical protein
MQGVREKSKQEQEEAREINMSLLALKQCIRDIHAKAKRIPFRNSKLTMILRDYLLAKQSKTALITNVSPSSVHKEKTVNALHYAELVCST